MNSAPVLKQKGDFTAGLGLVRIAALAVVVGAACAGVAWVLLKLIDFFTNVFYFHQLSFAPASPALNNLGAWSILVPRARSEADLVASLDVSVLQDALLAPILEIEDVRTSKRIDFVGGSRGARELERLVDSGEASAAFSMFPVSVADLMAVSDAGAILPPKSTWFEPKLRDGLLIHLI